MRNADNVTVKVSRNNFETETVTFEEEPTLEMVLDRLDYTLSSSESCSVNGQIANMSSIIEDGDTIQIVGKKEGGLI